jgi:hypothetical protein
MPPGKPYFHPLEKIEDRRMSQKKCFFKKKNIFPDEKLLMLIIP